MDRLVVTGGSGLLGSNLAYLASSKFDTRMTYNAHPVNIRNCTGVKMDLRDRKSVMTVLREFNPHAIIHTAALLPAKLCEENPDLARAIHVDGVKYLCEAAEEGGAKLIHISTDWIFDGTKERYKEEDEANPVNEYGRSKLEGERIIQASGVAHCIVRTSIYGWNLRINKLCYTEMVLDRLVKNEEFQAPDDQFFAPILVNILAEALFEIYAKGIGGVLHVTGSEACSRYHFCQTVAQVFGLNRDLIKPIRITREYFGVAIPTHQSLDVTRAKSRLETHLPSIRDGIVKWKQLRDEGYVDRLRGKQD